MDVENIHDIASEQGDLVALGLRVFSSAAPQNFFRFELYTYPDRSRRGFYVDLYEDGHPDTIADEHDLPGLTDGAPRVRFDPATKVLSLYFDVSQADPEDWIPFTTISVGDTEAEKSVDWTIAETDFFSISVYCIGVDLEEGEVRADNFTTIGGFRP